MSVCTGRYPGFGTSPKACHNFSSWCVDGNQDLILFVPHWHTCSAVQLHLAKNARGGNSLNTVVTVLTALCCVWLFLLNVCVTIFVGIYDSFVDNCDFDTVVDIRDNFVDICDSFDDVCHSLVAICDSFVDVCDSFVAICEKGALFLPPASWHQTDKR